MRNVHKIGNGWVEFYWDDDGLVRHRPAEAPKEEARAPKKYKHTRTRAQRRAVKRARRARKGTK